MTVYRLGMGIDWNAEVVDQLESHWQYQLRPRLDGLTDDSSKTGTRCGSGTSAASAPRVSPGRKEPLLRDLYLGRDSRDGS